MKQSKCNCKRQMEDLGLTLSLINKQQPSPIKIKMATLFTVMRLKNWCKKQYNIRICRDTYESNGRMGLNWISKMPFKGTHMVNVFDIIQGTKKFTSVCFSACEYQVRMTIINLQLGHHHFLLVQLWAQVANGMNTSMDLSSQILFLVYAKLS